MFLIGILVDIDCLFFAGQCCHCLNRRGVVTVRCKQCLRRPLRIGGTDKEGSPPMKRDEYGCTKEKFLFQSISFENLDQLLRKISRLEGFSPEEIELVKEVFKKEHFTPDEITSDWIRNFLLRGGQHPAKKYPDLFSVELPEAGLTYQWSLGLGSEQGLLSYTKPFKGSLRVWLDVLFIDQLSDNVTMNLARAQEIFCLSPIHLVIPKGFKKDGSPSLLLSRGWCIVELCLRGVMGRKSTFLGDEKDLGFKGVQHDYVGKMKLTVEKDREVLERVLASIYGDRGGRVGSLWKYQPDRPKLNAAIAKQILSGMRDVQEVEEDRRAIEEEEKKFIPEPEVVDRCVCF